MRPLCIVCAEDVEVAAICQCNHFVCAICALRMRVKMNRKLCCVCNATSEKILLTKNVPELPKSEVMTDHPDLQWDLVNPRCRLYDFQWALSIDDSVDKSVLDLVRNLRDPNCQICYKQCNILKDLEQHLWQAHRVEYCNLCVQSRSVFLSEQLTYGRGELYNHVSMEKVCRKDPPQFRGHPSCDFCHVNYYDNDQLFEHLHKYHETCHICQKNGDGYDFNYYQDLGHLERHFRTCHAYCDHPECTMSPMERVFATDFDLKYHQSQCHAKGRKERGKVDVLELGFNFGDYGSQQQAEGRNGGKGGKGKGKGGKGRYEGRAAQDREAASASGAATAGNGVHIVFNHGASGSSRSPNLSAFAPSDPRTNPSGRRGPPPELTASTSSTSAGGQGGGLTPSTSPHEGSASSWPNGNDGSPTRGSPTSPPVSGAESGPQEAIKHRNRELMQRMRDTLGEEKFKQFRAVSSEFLKGEMKCAEYYRLFVEFFGKKGDSIFAELVDLLPDPSKKDALMLAHNHYHSKEFGKPTPSQKKEKEKKAKQAAEAATKQDTEDQWPTLAPNTTTTTTSSSSTTTPAASSAPAASGTGTGTGKGGGGGGGARKPAASAGKPSAPKEDFPSLATNQNTNNTTNSNSNKNNKATKNKKPAAKKGPAVPNVWTQNQDNNFRRDRVLQR